MGMPGGASLYSLSVAWVSSIGALAPKRGLCIVVWLCSLCCQATIKLLKNQLTKGFKGPFVNLRARFRV